MDSELKMKGIAASGGIAIGKLIKIGGKKIYTEKGAQALNLFYQLQKALIDKIESVENMHRETQELFDIYMAILNDPYFEELIKNNLEKNLNLTEAIEATSYTIAETLSQTNAYIKQRINDIKRLTFVLQNPSLTDLKEDVIVYNDSLEIIDFIGMDMNKIKGIVTLNASKISHIAIWARSKIIPLLYGIDTKKLNSGHLAILDAKNGVLIVNPSKESLSYAQQERVFLGSIIKKSRAFKKKSITYEKRSITIAANIGNAEEAYVANEQGADGVGLFRTEFMFLSKNEPPSEDEQFKIYSEAADVFDSPVVIRTMDIGADKQIGYLDLKKEQNPFLGLRGLRLSLKYIDLFKTQLKALLRAAYQHNNIHIMFPMVTTKEEFQRAQEIVYEVKDELKKKSKDFGSPPLGIMVEVPACALNADKLSNVVDFMSIGTNDLIQYTMAMDRTNNDVGNLYLPHNNAVITLISNVINACHANDKWAGMCGAVASDTVYYPLLLELGLDEFSVVPSQIPIIKMYHSYLMGHKFPSLLPWDESKITILKQLTDQFWQWVKE